MRYGPAWELQRRYHSCGRWRKQAAPDGDRAEAAKRPPLRNERARPSAHSGPSCAAQADWHISARDALQNLLVDRISRFGAFTAGGTRRTPPF